MNEPHSLLSRRAFFLGDSWAYYKFYSGPKTADLLLTRTLGPLVDLLLAEGRIDSWFFVRYADPHLHLRLRLQLCGREDLSAVICRIHDDLAPWVERRLVWRVQTDTYQREIERYGRTMMELSEELFCLDSRMVVGILKQFHDDSGERKRWLMALRAIDRFLDDFELTIKEKSALIGEFRDGIIKEIRGKKNIRRQLNEKYRRDKREIEDVLKMGDDTGGEYGPLVRIITERSAAMRPLVKMILEHTNKINSEVNRNELIRSFLHMMMNRFFRSSPNLHELVLYDYLALYYHSTLARRDRESQPHLV